MLLTFKEASEVTKLSVPTLRRFARRGELQVARIGRAVRIPKQSLEQFVAARLSAQPSAKENVA